jgi:hypothetical protein
MSIAASPSARWRLDLVIDMVWRGRKKRGRRREVWKLERWLWPVATPGVGSGEVGCSLMLYCCNAYS